MGICSGISTKRLFIHCFQIEVEFRSVNFCGGRKTREKPLEQGWVPTTYPHMTLCLGIEPGPHWWEASALTTVPSLLSPPYHLAQGLDLPLIRALCVLRGVLNVPHPTYPQQLHLGWEFILTLSFSALNRVLEPSVLMELKLSDGKIHTFEVSVESSIEIKFDITWSYVKRQNETFAICL